MKATEATGRRIVAQRSAGVCEVRVEGVCTGQAREWQHRKARGQGGTWAPSNGIHACSRCHAYIHQHPAESVGKGWTVPSWADPAEIPALVWLWGHMQALALLDDTGCFHLAERPEVIPDDAA